MGEGDILAQPGKNSRKDAKALRKVSLTPGFSPVPWHNPESSRFNGFLIPSEPKRSR